MDKVDKCFFCDREMDLNWERIFFDPNHAPDSQETKDFSILESCCMSCEGEVEKFMKKQVINNDGKLFFFLDDGERWWYLGDSKEQVIKYHTKTMDDDVEIECCDPISRIRALKTMIKLDNCDGEEISMFEAVNYGKNKYDDGVCCVESSVY